MNVATKSGTNAFRGNLYDFFRSDALSTNTYDNKANEIEQGQFKRHQMGFCLGGPVVKDKVHFFLSGEYIRVRGSDTQTTWVPTPELIAASSPATRAFFTAYGGNTTINGPILTRERGLLDPRQRRRAPSTTCLPTCPCSARCGRRLPHRRRRRRSPERLPGRGAHGLRPQLEHPGLRPLRLPEPADGAGHELREPLRRLRHGLPTTSTTTSSAR